MKNYLTLAAFLGAIAFLSVSYLAQAEPEAGTAMTTTTTTTTEIAPATDAAAPALTGYAKDEAECDALAAVPTAEGVVPSDEEKAAAAKKCLISKGHTEEEIAKEAAAKAAAAPAAPAAPEAAPAPAAPAAQ